MSSLQRNFITLILLIPLVMISSASTAFAQGTSSERTAGGPRRQIATIIFAGLGGAILGLSTLSFYPRPQDKLGNIATGFAVGIIVGTIVVTYKAASNPSEMYSGLNVPVDEPEFLPVTSSQVALDIHTQAMNRLQAPSLLNPQQNQQVFKWAWSF